jgi:hypothetical protein
MAVRWISAADERTFMRMTGQTFGFTVDANGQYDIMLYETTLFCPRFNNSGSQISVLILQGTDPLVVSPTCNYHVHFFNEFGTLLYSHTIETIDWLFDVDVLSLSSIGAGVLAGQKGGAIISHTCGYGGIAAKLVALEPSTGFSFDTPCTYLPR